MIRRAAHRDDPLARDRLLLVSPKDGQASLADGLARSLPEWTVATESSYFSAIASAAARPPRAVIAWVDPGSPNLAQAVGGLREAVGNGPKLLLCCTPENEPAARSALRAGADDYVLFPLDTKELNAALGCPDKSDVESLTFRPTSGVDPKRPIALINELLAALDGKPILLIQKAAGFLLELLAPEGVSIVVEGAVATAGQAVTRPVVTAPIRKGSQVVGQIMIGPPTGMPFSPVDVETLSLYATMVGRLLETVSKTKRLTLLAMTDECTRLPNRRYLIEQLGQILNIAGQTKIPVTLLLFDVDDFKRYNDEHGHDVGDQILREIGRLFARHCREQDVVARFGGDEFAVVFWDADGPRMPGSRHPECALGVLDRVKHSLADSEESIFGHGQGRLTISGGLATYPWDANEPAELIKRADQALIAAKKAGKNRIFLIGDSE